ncbi:MAG: SDR family oxidoreductase [Chloroflexi bacterium]|jgi:2-dehydro-3-deoxy-D-gluconate 5-dehydrogenase|nr:SDR family oxidoreductase [Chloroflexota bacterium]MBT4073681.1 SDR family oxidoreductase [Chloroflexota bacterium]MBT4515418.1 SDR family oxidoreductase [Chloroflexota bacterium]MBT6682521.1 SDR family oxidoreductase [Chloroflexota bacterium]
MGVLDALNLDGMNVVITGGGTGLGLEMVRGMAEAGANIAIAGRRQGPIDEAADMVKSHGRKSMAISTDVTDTAAVNSLFETVLAEWGDVHVLFNNAGIVRETGRPPLWEITDESWRIGIETNLSSAFYCARAISKHMADRGSGKIVNVASGFGFRGGRDNYMYTAGKGGVVNVTRAMAVSLGRYGITCNAIVPGFFPTEATNATSMSLPRGDLIPIGRTGFPKEFGPVAVWLASAASDYMTGEMFIVDGGGLAGGMAPTGYGPITELA